MAVDSKRIINGTHGEVWLDGDYVAEVTGLQAKIAINKEKVQQCGDMWERQKVTGYTGTGSLKINKVFSRMAIKLRPLLKEKKDVRFTIITKLADPDSFGCERIVIKDVSFDDLLLADWAASTLGKVECPFTFADYDELDIIAVQ
jgi:hypothetical protein